MTVWIPEEGPDSLDSRVRDMIAELGLWGYHNRDSRRAQPGWPDWFILGQDGGLFRELKSTGGDATDEQRHLGAMLLAAGFDWAIWKPADWINGTIRLQLRRIAGCRGPN